MQIKRVGTSRAGWQEIGGKQIYFRSQWEANFARYLQFLKAQRAIVEWEFEKETFWFEAIKRGVRSYLVDFTVTENNGKLTRYEVKGYMDSKSKTKLKRLKKYHPDVELRLVTGSVLGEIKAKLGRAIGWVD